MKKITISILAVLFTVSCFAQIKMSPVKGVQVKVPARNYSHTPSTKTASTFYIDYNEAEKALTSYTYQDNWAFPFNMRFEATAVGTYNYFAVCFDSIYDSQSFTGYAKSSITNIVVDSIFAVIGHENNSGNNDTLIIQLRGLTTTGMPSSTILWADTIIDNSSFTADASWLQPYIFSFGTGIDLSTKKNFSIIMKYYGPKSDTIGFIAGHSDGGACGTGAVSAYKSLFWPNSRVQYADYASYGLLPSASGDIYYDCNSNSNFDTDANEYTLTQNIAVWARVTVTIGSGISENQLSHLKLYPNQPNPAQGYTNIKYDLTKNANVTFELFDLTGRKVMEMNEGNVSSGAHTLYVNTNDLKNGVYYYTLTAGDAKLTQKMIVN